MPLNSCKAMERGNLRLLARDIIIREIVVKMAI